MRNVCILTNYNYSQFLGECLESVVAQSVPFDLIIAVDDGSTDSSRAVIEAHAKIATSIVAILKDNGGQLSCFNAAVSYVRKDDLLWFIDADDVFPRDYVENTTELLRSKEVDCVFVKPVAFSQVSNAPKASKLGTEQNLYLPMTSAVTRECRAWFGAPTSCLTLKGSLFLSLFPYPYEQDWITRADDVVVFASSIAGARKLYARSLGVGYRTHEANNFLGKRFDDAYFVTREFRLERLFGWYEQKLSLHHRPSMGQVMREIALVPKAFRKQFLVPNAAKLIRSRYFGSLPSVVKRLALFRY